jgi:hypothetical protein
MVQLIISILFFGPALLGFGIALWFSKFKGESDRKCENEENCVLRKLGLSKLHCGS